jgi:three-Cys-motif partner protein
MPKSIPPSPDGHVLPGIARHSLKKIDLHNRYAEIFATGMSKSFRQRVYIGLCAGAGLAYVRGTDRVVETSALAVFRIPTPFSKYILVDGDPACCAALEHRIGGLGGEFDFKVICRDVNESIPEVLAELPAYSKENRLLTLCFVDPFRMDVRFDAIRELGSQYFVDFIILMMNSDLKRNYKEYFDDPNNRRVEEFLGDPDWRTKQAASGMKPVPWLIGRFMDGMEEMGYIRPKSGDILQVNNSKNVALYHLAFFSRNERGIDFWRKSLQGASTQLGLGL